MPKAGRAGAGTTRRGRKRVDGAAALLRCACKTVRSGRAAAARLRPGTWRVRSRGAGIAGCRPDNGREGACCARLGTGLACNGAEVAGGTHLACAVAPGADGGRVCACRAEVENVGCSAAVGATAHRVRARRRSLAIGAAIRGVAADIAAVPVALCGVATVAVGDDGAGLLAGVGVIAGEALRETGYVGKRAGAAAAARGLADERVEGAGGAGRAQR